MQTAPIGFLHQFYYQTLEHMAARLKRAVIRQTHPILIETFDGVEAAKREQTQKAADEPLPHFREMRGIFK